MAATSTTGPEEVQNNNNGPNIVDERDKLSGQIKFKVNKFAELANAGIARKYSKEKLCIRGLIWRIVITKNQDINTLGIYISCQRKGKGWSCQATITLRVISHKKEAAPAPHIERSFMHTFYPTFTELGFDFMKLETILETKNEYLDKDGALHISATIQAEEPLGVNYITRPDVLLVDDEEVGVNKHHLACKSEYFKRYFFGENAKKNTELVLDAPFIVEDFKRMMDTMHPDKVPLDDDCIEGVYHLANQFLLGEVEAKCRNFLAEISKRSAVFKYRLADKYGFQMLKRQLLSSSKKGEFFKEDDFFENLNEFAKLDEKARKELNKHLGKLFGKEVPEEGPPAKRARATN